MVKSVSLPLEDNTPTVKKDLRASDSPEQESEVVAPIQGNCDVTVDAVDANDVDYASESFAQQLSEVFALAKKRALS